MKTEACQVNHDFLKQNCVLFLIYSSVTHLTAFDVTKFWLSMEFHEIWYVCSICSLEQS